MSAAQQPLNALPQGHRLQEYELVRVLGFGGFGMTYLGFDHNLDKAVAIKEYLPSDIATRIADHSVAPQASEFRGDFQWGLERFLDEARTLARFDHRHIIKVYRFFEAHGTAYIVMEYAEGETLSAYLTRKGTLTEAELKGILYPLLDGLAVVHGADFLHRDIKPGNIVLRDADGSPVLLDFGAARQAIGAKSRSVTSIVTPGYAPLEQYSSRGRQGAWTDIYALGGVCYRALTGDVPADATDRVRRDPLVAVSQRCAGRASAGFLSAIDEALSVDEEDRPPSVAAWRTALEASVPVPVQEERRREQAAPLVDTEAAAAQNTADSAPIVRDSKESKRPSKSPDRSPLPYKWIVIALSVIAVVWIGLIVDEQAEQAALEKQRREQAALEKQRREQAALDKQRREQAALEKQRREQVALEKQRREQAALEKQRREQAALDKQRREQAALKKQRREQAALDKQRREQRAAANAKDKYGRTPLHRASEMNASETVAVLLKQGASVNARTNDGWTPLHVASRVNALEAVAVLLKQGASVNAKDDKGWTPLYYASGANASETVEVLLKQGASVNARDNDGWTPLHRASGANASEAAAVLLMQGASVNARDNDGWTPLHRASLANASEAAAVLLMQGASVNAKDDKGWTPLHWASVMNASETAAVLLNQGASVNAKDDNGYTPLHRAFLANASETAAVLLNQGASVNAKDDNGLTPLHYAVRANASEAAAVLRRYGGKK